MKPLIGLNGAFCYRLGFNNCRTPQTKASVAGQDADRRCERVDIAFKLGTIGATALRAKGRARLGRVKGSCENGSLGEIALAKSGEYRNIIHFLLLLLEEKNDQTPDWGYRKGKESPEQHSTERSYGQKNKFHQPTNVKEAQKMG